MSITGSDSSLMGFKGGGTWEPREEAQQSTALTTVPQLAMGISTDTLNPNNMVLTTSEEQRTGHFKPDPSKPTLAHLQQARMGALPTPTDDSWKGQYDALVDKMSQPVKDELNQPFDRRNSSYGALDNVTQAAAKTMTWVEGAQATPPPGSVAAAKAQNHQLFPYAALQGGMANGEEMASNVEGTLADVGANFPGHTAWSEALDQYRGVFSSYSDVAGRALGGKANADDVQQLRSTAGQMQGVVDAKDTGTPLITAHLAALSRISQAFRAPTEAAPPTLLGASIGSAGLNSGGASDPLRGNVGTLMTPVTAGGLGTMSSEDTGAQSLVKSLTTGMVMAEALLTRSVLKGMLGPTSAQGGKEAEGVRNSELALSLQVAVTSGMPQALFGGIATAAGVPEGDRTLFQQHMMLGSLLTVGAVAHGDNTAAQAELLGGIASHYTDLVGSVAATWSSRVAESNQSDNEEGVDNGKANAIAAFLQESSNAAKSGDIEGSLQSLWSATSLAGISQDELFRGTRGVNNLSDDLLRGFHGEERGGATEVALTI